MATRYLFSALALLGASAPIFAQDLEALEKMDDPYMAGTGHQSPAFQDPFRGSSTIVQVNVNSSGNNILNDAANEPSMWVDPTNPNRIAIGWRQFDNIASNFRQGGFAYSSNGGSSWTFPGVLEPGVFRSDPVLSGTSTGDFYYNSLQTTFFTDQWFSSNGGTSWANRGPATGGDKQWMICDAVPGSPGNGNLYQIWSLAGNNYQGRQFSRSTDGGATWLDPLNVPLTPMWGTLDVDRDGNLYACGNNQNNTFYFLKSSSAKNPSLTPNFEFSRTVTMGGTVASQVTAINPVGLLGQSWIAVDKSRSATDGKIYMLSTVRVNASNPANVNLIQSTDGGVTFSAPQRLNRDPINQTRYHWFGTMSVAPNGRVDVFWYDTRNSGSNNSFSQLMYTYSLDAGATWSPETTFGPSFNHTLGYPSQNKIGDYIQSISFDEGVHLAFAATYTGGQDVYYLNVPAPALTVSGTLTLEDLTPGEEVGEVIEYQVLSGTNVLQSGTFVLGTGGTYAFPVEHFKVGTHEIRFKGATWLRKPRALVVTNTGASGIDLNLWNGDANGNNAVGPEDFTIISGNFGQSTALGDLDQDGEVGPNDFAILSNRFGAEGID